MLGPCLVCAGVVYLEVEEEDEVGTGESVSARTQRGGGERVSERETCLGFRVVRHGCLAALEWLCCDLLECRRSVGQTERVSRPSRRLPSSQRSANSTRSPPRSRPRPTLPRRPSTSNAQNSNASSRNSASRNASERNRRGGRNSTAQRQTPPRRAAQDRRRMLPPTAPPPQPTLRTRRHRLATPTLADPVRLRARPSSSRTRKPSAACAKRGNRSASLPNPTRTADSACARSS